MTVSPSTARTSALQRAIKLATLAVVVVVALGFVIICVRIVVQSRTDETRPADAIVVLGAAEYAGKPSPVLRARLDHAYDLYSRGLAPYVITTGGSGGDLKFSEGGVGRDYLASRGISERHIIAETYSDDTAESLRRVAVIMRRNGLHSCLAVSDPYHLYRIKRMLQAEGIEVFVSPRPQGPRPDKARLWNLMREASGYLAWKLHITQLR